MLKNILTTPVRPLGTINEINSWENRPFNVIWPETKQLSTKDNLETGIVKKKSKRKRTAYTTGQLYTLENLYKNSRYIDSQTRKELARRLNVTEKRIKIWFQNRRMKDKKGSSESSDSSIEGTSIETLSHLPVAQAEKIINLPYETQHTDYVLPEIQIRLDSTPQYCYSYGYNYASGLFQNDYNFYPSTIQQASTQYYPTSSMPFNQTPELLNYSNGHENYEWQTSTFNINEFQQ